MYINVLSVAINECEVRCRVDLADQTLEFDVIRLEGGQRFLVPEDIQNQILDHLWAGGMVDISLGRYKGQIAACNFQKAYKTMLF